MVTSKCTAELQECFSLIPQESLVEWMTAAVPESEAGMSQASGEEVVTAAVQLALVYGMEEVVLRMEDALRNQLVAKVPSIKAGRRSAFRFFYANEFSRVRDEIAAQGLLMPLLEGLGISPTDATVEEQGELLASEMMMLGLQALLETLTGENLGRLVAGPLGLPKKRKKSELVDLSMCVFFCLDKKRDGKSALAVRQQAGARRSSNEEGANRQSRGGQTARQRMISKRSSGRDKEYTPKEKGRKISGPAIATQTVTKKKTRVQAKTLPTPPSSVDAVKPPDEEEDVIMQESTSQSAAPAGASKGGATEVDCQEEDKPCDSNRDVSDTAAAADPTPGRSNAGKRSSAGRARSLSAARKTSAVSAPTRRSAPRSTRQKRNRAGSAAAESEEGHSCRLEAEQAASTDELAIGENSSFSNATPAQSGRQELLSKNVAPCVEQPTADDASAAVTTEEVTIHGGRRKRPRGPVAQKEQGDSPAADDTTATTSIDVGPPSLRRSTRSRSQTEVEALREPPMAKKKPYRSVFLKETSPSAPASTAPLAQVAHSFATNAQAAPTGVVDAMELQRQKELRQQLQQLLREQQKLREQQYQYQVREQQRLLARQAQPAQQVQPAQQTKPQQQGRLQPQRVQKEQHLAQPGQLEGAARPQLYSSPLPPQAPPLQREPLQDALQQPHARATETLWTRKAQGILWTDRKLPQSLWEREHTAPQVEIQSSFYSRPKPTIQVQDGGRDGGAIGGAMAGAMGGGASSGHLGGGGSLPAPRVATGMGTWYKTAPAALEREASDKGKGAAASGETPVLAHVRAHIHHVTAAELAGLFKLKELQAAARQLDVKTSGTKAAVGARIVAKAQSLATAQVARGPAPAVHATLQGGASSAPQHLPFPSGSQLRGVVPSSQLAPNNDTMARRAESLQFLEQHIQQQQQQQYHHHHHHQQQQQQQHHQQQHHQQLQQIQLLQQLQQIQQLQQQQQQQQQHHQHHQHQQQQQHRQHHHHHQQQHHQQQQQQEEEKERLRQLQSLQAPRATKESLAEVQQGGEEALLPPRQSHVQLTAVAASNGTAMQSTAASHGSSGAALFSTPPVTVSVGPDVVGKAEGKLSLPPLMPLNEEGLQATDGFLSAPAVRGGGVDAAPSLLGTRSSPEDPSSPPKKRLRPRRSTAYS